uniref:Serine/threonine protein kinase putative n=1 Tax=Albugo laibachii Nc14 TaxID=890382 RepID=F0W0I6_9STRA|nr:serine/threonine protein kinase putative [Albugo laibachii Nc14]|eukprot:CCA14558.1 serine/threonine protein kinase putative [Albugo laibachii Nc14]
MESESQEYIHENETDRPMEHSPRGRYIRFETKLGSGAYKTVYKAYDTDQGIDVAWNAIGIGLLPNTEKTRIIQEVQLLQKLEHKNIINFYGSWFCKEKNQVVFITEIMTSGTLKSYIKRVQFVKWKIIKRWCLQILEGLHYLHCQNPAVIHRDLKCDNIFINGNTGDLRIGDLGLSTQLAVHKQSRAQSVLGTPEFMAPELYDESYDEKVDIYAFGMCVLEMVTKEVPYIECLNPAQIYKKVTAGIRPRGLRRVVSHAAREFIELCLSRGNGEVEVTAEYLMSHPFLKAQDDDNDYVKLLDDEELLRIEILQNAEIIDAQKLASRIGIEQHSIGSPCPSLAIDQLIITAKAFHDIGQNESLSASILNGSLETVPETQPTDPKTGAIAVDEPLSGTKSDQQNVKQFLDSLPGSEHNVQNTRINVMMGRGDRLTLEDEQCQVEEDQSQVGDSRYQSERSNRSSEDTTLTYSASDTPSLASTRSAHFDSGPSIQTKRGRGHDIKASKDPDNPHSILLNLRITIDGKSKEIQFPFNLYTDSSHEVACELALDVGILEPELEDISDSINFLVTEGKSSNLPHVDQDVWEEAPEPHSFSSKPLPHVSKMTFHTNPMQGTTMLNPRTQSPSYGLPDGYENQRTNGSHHQRNHSLRSDALLNEPPRAVSALPSEFREGRTSPRRRRPLITMSSSESQRTSDEWVGRNSDERDHEMALNGDTLSHTARPYAFDDHDSSLEAEIRSEEEKHQREIQRFRKKIQELEQKQRAKARQERLLSGEEYASELDYPPNDPGAYVRGRSQPMQQTQPPAPFHHHHSFRMMGKSPPKERMNGGQAFGHAGTPANIDEGKRRLSTTPAISSESLHK